MHGLLKWLGLKERPGGGAVARRGGEAVAAGGNAIFDQYEDRGPANQNAVDLLPGWTMRFPPECGVEAGALALHQDERIAWACERYGDLGDASVLELGPLEGGHTLQLVRQGARVLAIEANKIAYLKCLVVKEVTRLERARFMLGDFRPWMEETGERYDLLVASGVLYHMRDPLRLLELMARCGRAIYLWTHYVSDEAMPVGDPRRPATAARPDVVTFRGRPVRLYKRGYANAQDDPAFSGGMADFHHWMHRDDIIDVLRLLGFDRIEVAHERPDHRNGPCFSVFARASGAGGQETR